MDMNQNSALLDKWVGNAVFLWQLGGGLFDAADRDAVMADPGTQISVSLEETAWVAILEGYDKFGITLRHWGGGDEQIFLPWGAVLHIEGRPNNPAG